jgi:hypothetical protein
MAVTPGLEPAVLMSPISIWSPVLNDCEAVVFQQLSGVEVVVVELLIVQVKPVCVTVAPTVLKIANTKVVPLEMLLLVCT